MLIRGKAVMDREELLKMASEIVSAYVQNNTVDPSDLPSLIGQTFNTLSEISEGGRGGRPYGLEPPVPIEDSVQDDYIVCLEDGKQFKSLKRHLRSHYDLSPDEYRAKWGLASDYPMVAPNYAKARSKLAKDMQLGRAKGD
jgi:MucR family transcriptional regulator, transcriptional regulator of exopolysaccharide biosynthesis